MLSRFLPKSLRARLLLLVIVATAPMVAMTVVTGVRERTNALATARDNLQRLTKLAAANEAQSIEGGMQILRDLSSVPAVLGGHEGCDALMADILSKNADYVNFGVIGMDGDVVCSAVPLTGRVNLGDRAHFRRAVAERRFIAGNYVYGRVVQKHTINMTFPIIKDTKVLGVLFGALDLTSLDKFVDEVRLPAGSRLWTIDSDGNVISRRPDPAGWFGKRASDELLKLARERPAPMLLLDSDGVERLYATARVGASTLSDYSVLIGVPQDDILADAWHDHRLALLGLATTVLLALLAAWLGGDLLVVRRIRTLADTANLIASGSLGTRTGIAYGKEEISELARSLDEMAEALEKKEGERDAAEALLLAADKRKDEFLAMLAHELRNPLAPISAGAQILRQTETGNPVVARTAEIIGRQVEHMKRLVDDLLDVSRVTRGLVKLNRELREMGAIVGDAVEQVSPLIASRRQQLTVQLVPGSCPVFVDHKRMVQVVANLLNNAAKYTPEGGHVQLVVTRSAEQVTLSVTDDGIGMAPELVERVFELFAQGERTSDRTQGGLGLGLALVKTLLQLHGGTVRAESAGLGVGSVFTIALPHPPASERASALLRDGPPAAAPGRLRCLVVDDNIDAGQTLALFLEADGHEVALAHSGAEALVMAHASPPQVCLLDIGLPDFDGNELVTRLRKLPETAGALMIAVTGYGRQEDRDKSIAAGFDHYFVKPLDTASLVAVLAVAAPQPVWIGSKQFS
ncbi:MAG: ATP-binding protein [Massilia sp.]